MAGTVRRRTWVTRKGEQKTAWMADYYDQSGERHRKSFATKKAADAWLVDTSSEIKSGVHVPDSRSITVKQAAKLWLERRELRGVERGSLRVYEQHTRLYIGPLIGARRLSQLPSPVIEAFCDKLLGQTSKNRAQDVLATLKMILNDMQRRGFVGHNAALPVRIEDNERDDRPVTVGVDLPSKAEVQALLRCTAELKPRARLVAAIFTGLRASELRALTWPDLDFSRRVLAVRRRADWWGTVGKPKSKHGYRDIPMTPLLVNTLQEWQRVCPRFPDGALDLVFPGPEGGVLSHMGLQHAFDGAQSAAAVIDAAGKPKYGLHALRHFFASWGIEQGFSPKRLQALLGHGSIQMTFDVYGHLFPSEADDHARLAAAETALLAPVRELAVTHRAHTSVK
jgi:integrase